jgi:UDP-N-acetylglucosamine transferase subunit ALG13
VEGVAQLGVNAEIPYGLTGHKFLSRSAMELEIARADVVISHAGVGTIHSALSHGKVPIVMARRRAFGECVNDHQLEIVRELAKAGALIPVDDENALERAVTRVCGAKCAVTLPIAAASSAPVVRGSAASARWWPGVLRVLASPVSSARRIV